MTSLDGVIAVPKGLKREARRLVVIAFLLAPVGVVAAFSFTQAHPAPNAQRTPSSTVTPTSAVMNASLAPIANTSITSASHTSGASSVHINTATTQSNATPPITHVQVNDQPVDVPANGSLHKVISSDNGTTTIDVNNQSSNSSSSSSSSMNIQLNSSSTTQAGTSTSTGP